MSEFIYYAADYVALRNDVPMRKFMAYFLVYGFGVSPVDRTGVIKFPVKTRSLFPIPKLKDGGYTWTYENVCNARAREILARAERLDVPIYVFWSGGVDSTTVLVSLLKVAEKAQKARLVVMLSEDSISEYPEFYLKHIRGKVRCKSAMLFPYMLGRNNLLVNGEGNDQLMGSDVIGDAVNRFGFDAVVKPYDRKFMHAFLEGRMGGDTEVAGLYAGLFFRLAKAAPIPLATNYDHLWWVNFTVKWQTVYTRMLSYGANKDKLTSAWIRDYYMPFFMTDEFQLWSMHNTDQRIKNGWDGYKWPSKQLIYQYTKDPVYRDSKLKRGSLQFLVVRHHRHNFIDSDYAYHEEVEPAEFYREDHDFK
jgi:hypothetical protein